MAAQELLLGNPRELGEQFKFIAEVTELVPPEDIEESFDKVNLISTAGQFGLIFIAHKTVVKAFRTRDLIDNREKTPASSFSCRGFITHISVNCDGLILFVVAIVNNSPLGFFYDTRNILQNDKETVPFYTIPLNANANSRVVSLAWNPCDSTCIALAFSTGDLSLVKIKEASVEFSNKNDLLANAVTWSAKGKQLAVGKADGTMSLFKPDLTHVRSVQAPSIQDVGPIFDITWFTNTEFFIGYHINNIGPALLYVNAPKGKTPSFVNFDDVCFSNESEKPLSYYTVFVSEWNLLFVFSSNGVELGVIGKTETESSEFSWCLWSPDEDAKALMHFYNVVDETYPLGLIIGFTSAKKFTSTDENMKGPFPFLATVSTKGELNIFFIENRLSNAQPLTFPCENLPLSGHRRPEQFGQPTSIVEPVVAETPPPEPKPSFMSAFSSFPQKTESSSTGSILFSTPVKPVASTSDVPGKPVIPKFISGNTEIGTSSLPFSGFASSSSGLFTLPSTSVNASNLSSFSKPVSMSNQIGSVGLPAPSPQKSENVLVLPPAPPPPIASIFSIPSTPQKSENVVVLPPSSPSQFPASSMLRSLPQSQTLQLKPQTPVPESNPPPPSPKISKESVLYHIRREEQQFEKELKEFRDSVSGLEKEVGKEKDLEFKVSFDKIEDWMKEMESTTKDQSDEVSKLHQETLEALALYEDAKSHRQIKFNSRNEIYIQLRPLDPYSKRKLDEIRSKYQYLITQINEVNAKLDLQFEELTKSRKFKRNQRPPDNLYRSVLNLHTMRITAEKELQKVTQQIKKLHISPIFSSSLLNSSFDVKSEKLQNILNDSISDVPLSIHSPSNSSSCDRNRQLKEILSQREHTPVRIHSVDVSPESASKQSSFNYAGQRNVEKASVLTPELRNVASKLVYEAISPTLPHAQSVVSPNPIAALSSLVGKVSSAALTGSSRSVVTSNVMNMTPISKSEGSAPLSAFSFSQMSKSSLGSMLPNDTKKEGGFSLFGSGDSQNQATKHSLSLSSELFAGNKITNGQGLSGTVVSQANLLITSKTEAVSSTSKSPLLDMLATTKSLSESTASVTPNFAQYFKGISPAASLTTATTTTTTASTSVEGISFSSLLDSSENKESKANKDIKPPFSQSSAIPSVSFSGFGLKPATEKSNNLFIKPEKENVSSQSVQASLKDSSVISNNPLLTSQILKETSIISSLCSSATSSTTTTPTFKASLFGQKSEITPTPAFSSSSVSSSNKESTSNSNILATTTSSTGISLFSSSQPSIFGNSSISLGSTSTVPSSSSSVFGMPLTSASIFGQLATSIPMFSQPSSNTSTSVFATPVAAVSQENLVNSSSSTQTSGVDAVSTSLNNFGTLLKEAAVTSSTESLAVTSSSGASVASTSAAAIISSLPDSTVLSTSTSIFDTSAKSSLFGQGNTILSSGQFPSSTSFEVEETKTVLGQAAGTPSLFNTVTTSASGLGLVSSPNSAFGNGQIANTLFNQSSSTQLASSASGSLFSMPSQEVSSSTGVSTPSVFGSGSNAFAANTSAQSIFGGSTNNNFGSIGSSSVFGNEFSSANSTQSIFGKPTAEVAKSSAPSVFGVAASSSSVFGGASSTPAFGSGSVFGQANKSEASTGSSSTWGSSSGSIFGGQSGVPFGTGAKNSGSIFGNTGTSSVSSSGSIFGNTAISSGGSIFGSTTTTTSSNGGIFGNAPTIPSSGSIFGGTTTTSSSIFGANNTSSLFSSGSFGQNSGGSVFGSASLFSGLGKAPSKEDSSKNVFGSVKTETSAPPNIFGGSGGTSTGSPFGSFTPQKTGGAFSPVKSGPTFGGGPVFGGSPTLGDLNKPKSVFGGGTSFGSPPVLGGGSPSVFGGSTTGGFGSSNPSGFSNFASSGGGTSFSSLANQSGTDTTGFSQHSQQPGSGSGSGGPFAGSSFTSWRS